MLKLDYERIFSMIVVVVFSWGTCTYLLVKRLARLYCDQCASLQCQKFCDVQFLFAASDWKVHLEH